VTLCFTDPAPGATLTGDATVSAAVTFTGTGPGIQRVIFYINGQYLLTDYQAPYTFNLPSARWVDSGYTLSVEALLRDSSLTPQASQTVTFANGVTGQPVNTNTFQPTGGTAPANGAPFVVAVGGDGASGETNATNVSNLIDSIHPNLFLYLGDVYEKGSLTEFYNWYGTASTNFGRFRAITNPTVGNHEYDKGSASGYFDYWDNVPNYYSFDAGGWHFVSLNSNSRYVGVDSLSAQYAWLQADLAAHSQACTIAYYHHPLFNIGPEGVTTAMADIWSLMASNHVTIVLNGHDHTYQRWVPLDGSGQPAVGGITEFVAGAAGHGLQTIANSDSRVAYSNSLNPDAFGVLKFELNPSGAAFSYINTTGSVLDSGVIPCVQSLVDTQPPSAPGNVSAAADSATKVTLTWSASTDNTGVSSYTVYRDGALLASVAGTSLGYSDGSVLPSSTYSYTVDAVDSSGNHSAVSNPVLVTTPAMPASMTFPVAADTYVSVANPASNYGAASSMTLDASPDLHAYLRFTVQGLAGTPIHRARLLVYSKSSSASGIVVRIVSDNNWGERTITYNNAPALGSQVAASGVMSALNWITLDVTSLVTGEGTYSFGLTTASTTALSLTARETGTNGAQLVLDLGPDVEAPSVPAGLAANAASATQVNLQWTASTDNVGVSQYNIYRDGNYLASVNGAALTYSDAAVQGLTTYTYTVAALDQAGNASAVSDPVSVTTPDLLAPKTFIPEADAYVNASYPTTNYGAATTLRLDASPDLHAYARFNVQNLPAGTPVTRATLKVYTNTTGIAGIKVLTVGDTTWGEKSVTYATAPALGAQLASAAPISGGSWVALDVTAYLHGNGSYSFAVVTTGASALSLASRESGANSPQLLIEFK
jgi:chitodextrinase